MKRVSLFALGLVLLAGTAPAQDCSRVGDPCSAQKYGMGTLPDFRRNTIPPDQFSGGPATITAPFDHDDFGPDFGGVSYGYNRADEANQQAPTCGRERGFLPLPGQIILVEQDGCVPTAEGPTCTGGSADGAACTLIGRSDECPDGGVCDSTGGCLAEIPVTDGGKDDPATVSELYIFNLTSGFVPGFGTFELSAATPNTWGGTSDETDPVCLAENLRLTPSMATRFILPAARGGDGSMTYLRWHATEANRLRIHTDDPAVCCNSPSNTVCNLILPGQPEYPLLAEGEACNQPNFLGGVFQMDGNLTADWIFEGGVATRFHTDSTFVVPGQTQGVCETTRQIACTSTGNECDVVGEQCDLSDRGVRVRPIAGSDGSLDSDNCATFVYVVRGAPDEGCSVLTRYSSNGDPGPSCRVINYGVRPQIDDDCDGQADFAEDKCPFLNEWDSAADADGDCTDGDPATPCRGDECECGDQTGDGIVDILDILEVNEVIFEITIPKLLADANNDLAIDVTDILGASDEIFVPTAAECRHVSRLSCGNGEIDAEEECDDGNQLNLDGCDTACLLE